MNLAVVTGMFYPRGGGAERSTSQIVDELVSRGHRVTIIAGFCPPSVVVPGATIQRFSTGGLKSAWRVARFSRWARGVLLQGQFDSSVSVTTAVPAALVQPRSGTVRETLDRNIAMRRRPLSRWTKRLLLRLSVKQQLLLALERRTLADPVVRWIVPGSRYVADQLRRHYQIDPSRIRLVPNAAEMPRVDHEQRRSWRRQVRAGLKIAEGSTTYLFAAYNPRLKGVEPLLQAAKCVLDKGVDATVILAGAIGYPQQHMAAKLGIRDRVRIVATTNQMAQLYAAADVTVHPTFYDPASKVVIESLMMGTAAISTSFNGASDFIQANGGSPRGRVIEDPADVEALAAAMIQLADPDQRRRCVAAMDGLADSLSMKRHVDQLEHLMAD